METKKLKNCFKKYGSVVATKKSKMIFNFIKNNGTKYVLVSQKSGIYGIKYKEGEIMYMGEMGRTVECCTREYSRRKYDNNITSLYIVTSMR